MTDCGVQAAVRDTRWYVWRASSRLVAGNLKSRTALLISVEVGSYQPLRAAWFGTCRYCITYQGLFFHVRLSGRVPYGLPTGRGFLLRFHLLHPQPPARGELTKVMEKLRSSYGPFLKALSCHFHEAYLHTSGFLLDGLWITGEYAELSSPWSRRLGRIMEGVL